MVDVIPDDTDYSEYATKELGPVVDEFVDWLRDQFPNTKIDERSVYLGTRMYGFFQRSETHQNNIDARRRGVEVPAARPAAGKRGRPATVANTTRGKTASKTAPAAKPAAKATKGAAAKPAARGRRGGGAAPY
jgi:hypothetical protein